MTDQPRPVTAQDAANRLGLSKGTIYSWVTRYGARRLGIVGRRTYYDFDDLARIDAYITNGQPVPLTPEERVA